MILDQFKLNGKVAIVTGARTGLGQGMACGLAEAGADIVAVDLNNLEDTRKMVEGLGRGFLGVEANIANIKNTEDIVNRAVATFGKVDILVNNAGIIRRCDAIDFTEKDWDEVMDINLKTVFFFSQAVARQFIRSRKRAAGSSTSLRCSLSRAGSASPPIPPARAASWV